MIQQRTRRARHWPTLIVAGAVSATLAACGGSSGDDDGSLDPFGDGDVNGDGIMDTPIGEPDASGVQAYDINGDGFADVDLGLGQYDVNNDGVEDRDVNGDGIVDDSVVGDDGLLIGYETDPRVEDRDGTADSDASGEPLGSGFVEPSASAPCGSAGGRNGTQTDATSENNTWSDNCNVSVGGQFSNSLYMAGIQRVVWCADVDGGPTASSVDAFTDADGGPATDAAIRAYQRARGLTADGVVGGQTWQVMQDELTDEPLDVAVGGGLEPYGVKGERCENLALFLNEVSFENSQLVMGGWQLTRGATNPAPVPFTIEPGASRVD